MTIIILRSNNPFALNNASTNRLRTLAEGLVNAGVKIYILITQGYTIPNEFRKFRYQGAVCGVKYVYLMSLPNNILFFRRLSLYVFEGVIRKLNVRIASRIIKEIKPDIIWLASEQNVYEVFLNLKLSLIPDFRLFIELNEIENAGIVHATNKFQNKKSQRSRDLLLFKILPQVDMLAVMTRMLYEHYGSYAKKQGIKILHLPMTVDLNRFTDLSRRHRDQYIAYCGSTSFLKDGVDILLHSYSNLLKSFPGIKLKIAAPMEFDGKKMLSIIKQLNLEKHVEYLGEVQRENIPGFLADAKLLALPRPSSKQAEGGFPTKLGEYLATGNPVCVTTVGEIPDYLKDNESAFFAIPGSIESFTEAMIRTLSDPEHAELVGKAGKKVAEENFSMEVQSKRLYSFLTETLNRSVNV